MLGSSLFDNDPFFEGHREHQRQMEQMFSFGGGLGGGGGMIALPDNRHMMHQIQQQQAQNMQVGMFMDPFAHFNGMFSNMRSMMTDMHGAFDMGQMNPGNGGQVFQQSSFVSYNNSGGGAPQVFQATTSSRQGPDGVRETQNTMRDSETGVEKIAVGHHIRDRGHVVERSRNNKTGEANENQEYLNLDEEETPQFDQEYRDKWHSTMRGIDDRRHAERQRHAPVAGPHRNRYAALPEPEPRRHRKTSHRRE